MVAFAASTSSLKQYLKKYQSSTDDQAKKKKKKKTKATKNDKPKPNPVGAGVLVVDEDPVWQKPIVEEEEESADDEAPQIDEDIEVKRLKRLEAIRSRKPYNAISEDGSGWVSISNQSRSSNPSNSDDDVLSPPRQPRFDTPLPDRELKVEDPRDGDLSPPCQRWRRLDMPSPEPEPRDTGSGEIDVDLLPPRRNRNPSAEVDDDLSPPRKDKNRLTDVDDDLSPRRKNRNRSPDLDLLPPRKNRNRSTEVNDDLSPPRRNRNQSPEVDDLSPLRKNRNGSPDADLSPPRKRKELSVARDEDLTPPRKRNEPSLARDEDLSPPRKKREPSIAKETRRIGLLSAEEIRKENEKKRKDEIWRFASMDASMSGKGAEVIFRDKEGRRIKKENLLKAQEEEKPKEKKLKWGEGLAQKRVVEARIKELELEKDKPFARTRDDPDLDNMLKARIRWGDPMTHLVKKNAEPIFEDLGTVEKMKESGFIIPQSIPSHSWIKRGIDFPPNRHGIRPGRHWDRVDRSNVTEAYNRNSNTTTTTSKPFIPIIWGYEKELFKRQSEKQATETEAYLWSVSDM